MEDVKWNLRQQNDMHLNSIIWGQWLRNAYKDIRLGENTEHNPADIILI